MFTSVTSEEIELTNEALRYVTTSQRVVILFVNHKYSATHKESMDSRLLVRLIQEAGHTDVKYARDVIIVFTEGRLLITHPLLKNPEMTIAEADKIFFNSVAAFKREHGKLPGF